MGSQERVHRTLETEAARESVGQGRSSRSRRAGRGGGAAERGSRRGMLCSDLTFFRHHGY